MAKWKISYHRGLFIFFNNMNMCLNMIKKKTQQIKKITRDINLVSHVIKACEAEMASQRFWPISN